jgi:hypothetical protein
MSLVMDSLVAARGMVHALLGIRPQGAMLIDLE